MQTPAQVARKANVTAQSIRNYSRDYADLLSPAARGDDGPRLYTDKDVDTLCTIAALRKSGVPPHEVAGRVRNGDAPPIVDVVANAPLNDPQEALKAGQEASFAIQIVQSTLNARFEAIERRFEARERGALWWAWGQGIWLGMVLMGAIFFAMWLLVNGAK